jgi:hypothetical protein
MLDPHSSPVADFLTKRRTAPRFSRREKAFIDGWSLGVKVHGFRSQLASYPPFIVESLHVTIDGTDDPLWVVHKTPAGAFAARHWPGIADVVSTLQDALAIVENELRKEKASRSVSVAPT